MPKNPFFLKWMAAVLLVTALAVQGAPGAHSATPMIRVRDAISPQAEPDWTAQDAAIRQALVQTVLRRSDVPAFVVFDMRVESITYARAGDQALVWVARVERKTGQVLASEPGLFLAYRDTSGWHLLLPGDLDWQARLHSLPAELLTESIRSNFLAGDQQPQTDAPIGGFYLPWAAGQSKWLTMAANHVSCPSKCRYATDWADGTQFPVLAAKGGAVYAFQDTCEDDDHTCTNYLVLKDSSTAPESYQIYFHLAHDSIPPALKVLNPADPPQVLQGQFIAHVDNTGYSTGSHLHFMVVTNPFFCKPEWCNGDSYWWGTSVDITFKDVFTNWDTATQGGRPCTEDDVNHGLCAEWQETYTSANLGATPFTGGITQPANFAAITDPVLPVSGWAASEMGVTRIKVIVNDRGVWREVGDPQTISPFSINLDVCAAGIADGVFDLALRAWDGSGNRSTTAIGLRHLAKDTHCAPPPAPAPLCALTADQVALFAQPNFGGACVLLGQGSYPNAAALSPLSEHGVASLQVGQNVKAILYSGANFTERQETFISADYNLADHRVNSQQVSSIKVAPRAAPPAALTVIDPVPGPGGSPLTSIDSVILSWGRADGATSFQARLFQGVWDCSDPNLPAPYMTRQPDDYLPSPSWSLGTLPESTSLPGGKYSLCIRMRAPGAEDSMWYGRKLVVVAGTLPEAVALPAPYYDDMEEQASGWTASGLWHWVSDPRNSSPNHSWAFSSAGGGYAGDIPSFGDLTSPLINLPAGGSYYLRFDYHYQTETATPHWDQRWLQISKDGGRFENLLQLSDESMAAWLRSPYINLSAYAGSLVRLRFHFDSIDTYYNAGLAGWFIDNVTLNSTPPPSGCNEPVPNDTIETATPIAYGQTVTADICPAGDVDYYKITAAQGDVIQADIDAQTLNPPSQMIADLDLFMEGDPTSVLAESTDELPGMQLDPYLGFIIPQAGTYYLRVKDRNYPGQGSPAHNYTLKVLHGSGGQAGDTTDPNISLVNPSPGLAWRQAPQVITAQANDNPGGSGMQRVDFLWHPADWSNDFWLPLYTDWNGANGWNAFLDASQFPEGQTIGIAARAVDWAGNVSVAVDFDIVIDSTPPVVNFTGELPTEDTALLLRWDASDAASGIDYFIFEVNRDNNGWQPVDARLPGDSRQAWYIGEFGHGYQFRLRAVDFADNESAPAQIGTTLTTCQPDAFDAPVGDGSLANAKDLPLEIGQPHNFCGVADQDWVKFTPQAGQTYLLWAAPDPGSPAAPVLGLYRADGALLMEANSPGYGQWTVLKWVAPDNGVYYLRARSLNPAIAGTHITYQFWAGVGRFLYFAYISK